MYHHTVGREVSGRVEKLALQRRTVALHSRPGTLSQRAGHLGAVGVVGKVGIVLVQVVEDYPSVGSDQRHALSRQMVRPHVSVYRGLVHAALGAQCLVHTVVEVLQPYVQGVYLVLFFPCLLVDDKGSGKNDKDRDDPHVELLPDRDSSHLIPRNSSRSPVGSRYVWRTRLSSCACV